MWSTCSQSLLTSVDATLFGRPLCSAFPFPLAKPVAGVKPQNATRQNKDRNIFEAQLMGSLTPACSRQRQAKDREGDGRISSLRAPGNRDERGAAARERDVHFQGWLTTSALRKTLVSVELPDGSGYCQCIVLKELCEESQVKRLTRECANDVVGELKAHRARRTRPTSRTCSHWS